jgi:hypothetical protein
MNDDDKEFNGWGGKGGGALGVEMISNFFDYYQKKGDAQMLATMFCVLNCGESSAHLLPRGRGSTYDTYILRYAELLYAWGLLNVRAEVNKHLFRKPNQNEFELLPSDDGQNEIGSTLGIVCVCPTCNTEIESITSNYCERCRDFAFRCSICDTAVRGLSTFCEECHHGGCFSHIVSWFSQNSLCPTGCGCNCTFSSPMPHTSTEIVKSEMSATAEYL